MKLIVSAVLIILALVVGFVAAKTIYDPNVDYSPDARPTINNARMPDVTITDLKWAVTNSSENPGFRVATINYTYKNIGTGHTRIVSTESCFAGLCNLGIGQLPAPGLAPGQGMNFISQYEFMPGTYTLTLKADVTNLIVELNESNNNLTTQIIL